jgi:hypothetical protein
MFRSESLKLYRKFLIMCVLLSALFVVLSANKSSVSAAAICCSVCDKHLDSCVSDCYGGDPRDFNKCMSDCGHDWDHCYGGPPPCFDC